MKDSRSTELLSRKQAGDPDLSSAWQSLSDTREHRRRAQNQGKSTAGCKLVPTPWTGEPREQQWAGLELKA